MALARETHQLANVIGFGLTRFNLDVQFSRPDGRLSQSLEPLGMQDLPLFLPGFFRGHWLAPSRHQQRLQAYVGSWKMLVRLLDHVGPGAGLWRMCLSLFVGKERKGPE